MTAKQIYGKHEFADAQPFADALVTDPAFRHWVIGRTRFADLAVGARLLNNEMLATRSRGAATWWRSYFTESCRCTGCSGQETDLLAIFETANAYRFALHFEVKNPRDKFKAGGRQAAAYGIRAKCWAGDLGNRPQAVLPHNDAATVLLCSNLKLSGYGDQIDNFECVIFFEEIADLFPHAVRRSA